MMGKEIIKRHIFQKWKKISAETCWNPIDRNGNEYYIVRGIVAIKINSPSRYKFGLPPDRLIEDRLVLTEFNPGFLILSTRTTNYTIIEDPDMLQYILNFDFTNKKLNIHKILRKQFGFLVTDTERLAMKAI